MSREMPLSRLISLLYRYSQIKTTRELEPYNIGRGQYLFLIVLYYKDGMSQDALCNALNIDKGTTARAISKLERAGYVQRKTDPRDMRTNRVYLTEAARDFKPRLLEILDRWNEILIEGLNKEEVETVFKLLTRMAENAVAHVNKDKR